MGEPVTGRRFREPGREGYRHHRPLSAGRSLLEGADMTRARMAGAIVAAVIAAGLIYFFVAAPFLWSEDRLKENVLSLTPMGSTHEQVLKAIEEQGWRPRGLNQAEVANHGFL